MPMSTAGNCSSGAQRPPQPPSGPSGGFSGFTLLELLVVLVVLAGVALLAAPKLERFLQENALRTTTRQFIGLVQQTAELARQEQRRYVLRYDARQHALVAEPADTAGQGRGSGKGRVRSLKLPDTVRLLALGPRQERVSGGEPRLYISGQGYTEPALISLEVTRGDRLSLVLSPFLGKIRVVDGDVDARAEKLFR